MYLNLFIIKVWKCTEETLRNVAEVRYAFVKLVVIFLLLIEDLICDSNCLSSFFSQKLNKLQMFFFSYSLFYITSVGKKPLLIFKSGSKGKTFSRQSQSNFFGIWCFWLQFKNVRSTTKVSNIILLVWELFSIKMC